MTYNVKIGTSYVRDPYTGKKKEFATKQSANNEADLYASHRGNAKTKLVKVSGHKREISGWKKSMELPFRTDYSIDGKYPGLSSITIIRELREPSPSYIEIRENGAEIQWTNRWIVSRRKYEGPRLGQQTKFEKKFNSKAEALAFAKNWMKQHPNG